MSAAKAVVITNGKFRKMPMLYQGTVNNPDYDAQKRCERANGHVLIVKGNEITCENCPARWRNEGF